jgi:hypothetical protein
MLFWKSWIDAAQFCFEAQSVIAMRLMKIAAGGQDGAAECTRMVLEKIDAGIAVLAKTYTCSRVTAGLIALGRRFFVTPRHGFGTSPKTSGWSRCTTDSSDRPAFRTHHARAERGDLSLGRPLIRVVIVS